jgi:P-type Cu2+ transporter
MTQALSPSFVPQAADAATACELRGSAQSELPTNAWQSYDSSKWRSFSQAEGQGRWTSNLKIQGMHCSACAGIVEQALMAVPGVISAHVDAMTARAKVTWDESAAKPSQWLSAVASAGYALLPIHGMDAIEQTRRERRAMLWRWLVAGFCTMQVMMYAWPNYGSSPGDIDATSDQLLRWASLLLTLPVVFFSCGPFFKSAWNDLRRGRISMDLPVSLGIGLTFLVSTLAVMEPTGIWGSELYFDSLTMLVFFLLTGRWLEAALKQRVAGQLDSSADPLPLTAELELAGGQTLTVPTQSLSVGDVIRVRIGESFAGDGLVVGGSSEAEESLLTGEALPVAKPVNAPVFAGTTNLSAPLRVRLLQVGADTRLGQMQQLVQNGLHAKPHIVQLADKIAKPFLLAVLCLAALAAAYWWPTDPHRAVLAAIAVLVVTCPCALALAAPAAFLSSASALAEKGLLVRNLAAIERLAKVSHFAFDKTGTLTNSNLDVTAVHSRGDRPSEQVLALAGEMAANSLHVVSQAIDRYLQKVSLSRSAPLLTDVSEVPGMGVQATLRKSEGSTTVLRLGSAKFCGIDAMAVSPGYRAAYLVDDDGLLAIFELNEELRPDAGMALQIIKDTLNETMPAMASRLSLFSGDAQSSVQRTAAQLGWADGVDASQSNCSAADKVAGLRRLKALGHQVAMVGDGINDSPVLVAADVSMAPAQGAALASVKADFLLTAQSLMPIAQALTQAKATMHIVKQNMIWALIYNALCVPLAVTGVLTPWMAGLGMAVSSLLVLLNSLRLKKLLD